jgi:peptide/nickel transport system permease protein
MRRLAARLCSAGVTLVGISLGVFLLLHLVPGDPVDVMLGERAAPADREALRNALGLSVDPLTAASRYFTRLAQGDLGISLHSREPIAPLLLARAPATLQLACAALLMAVALALPLGILSARWAGRWPDRLTAAFAALGAAVPGFVLGPLLILAFAVQLGWLPVAGTGTPAGLVLPACTLALGMAAILSRQLRVALLGVFHEPYLRAARARGLDARTVLWRHALRNAAIPVLTVLGMQLGALLGGAVITETVFAWPGLGSLTLEAIERRDYPLLQGCVLVISASYLAVNVLTDIALAWCDPRLRTMTRA